MTVTVTQEHNTSSGLEKYCSNAEILDQDSGETRRENKLAAHMIKINDRLQEMHDGHFVNKKRKPQIIRNGEKGRWTSDEHLVFVE